MIGGRDWYFTEGGGGGGAFLAPPNMVDAIGVALANAPLKDEKDGLAGSSEIVSWLAGGETLEAEGVGAVEPPNMFGPPNPVLDFK